MANDHSEERISAFDCDILCRAFRTSVAESRIAESEWRAHAMLLARELTDQDSIGPAVVDWIIGKDRASELESQGVTAVTDDKTKTDFRDRDPVSDEEEYEVRYFAEKFGLNIEQGRELIARHCNDRETLPRVARKLGNQPG